MIDSFDAPPEAAPRRRLAFRTLLLLSLVMLAIGAAAALWVVSKWQPARERLVGAPQVVRVPVRVPVMVPAPVADPASAAALAQTGAATAALATRIGTVESRLDEVDNRVQTAMGDANRAEGLLVAVAARRAIESGMPLGYLEGLLRARFGQSHAPAVVTILSAARQPVTLDELRAGLDAAAPRLSAISNAGGWWSRIHSEIAALVTVRRADEPSTILSDRIELAARLVDQGHVDRALAEVARLPNRDAAAAWIAEARRYLAARSSLEIIETAALLEPAAPAAVPPVLPAALSTGAPPAAD